MAIDISLNRDTPYWLNFIYVGQMYSLFHEVTVPAASTLYIEIRTDSRLPHFIARTLSTINGGPLIITEYENPTYTPWSIEIPSINLDRRSAKVATTLFYSNPTAVSGGTLIGQDLIPVNQQGQQVTPGTFSSGGFEMLLDNQ